MCYLLSHIEEVAIARLQLHKELTGQELVDFPASPELQYVWAGRVTDHQRCPRVQLPCRPQLLADQDVIVRK